MREIVVDTETTGLDPDQGHRVVEVGCVELFNHVATGRTFHRYINPERDMPAEAERVHGLSVAFLSDKPLFSAVAGELHSFLDDAPLVIHNAAFDLKFLNSEFRRLDAAPLLPERAIDTLLMARRRYPGASASLDNLCKRFNIDLTQRSRDGHGALLDAGLLAEVYLELIGGREPGLAFAALSAAANEDGPARQPLPPRAIALPSRLTDAERAAHEAFLKTLPGAAWLKAL